MNINKKWVNPATIVSISSAILSMVAISVSVKSCTVSQRSLELSQQDFMASRSVVYKATLNSENDEIQFAAGDPNIQLQYGTVYVPPQLNKTEWPIAPPKFGLPLVVMRNNVESFLDKKVIRERGYIKVIDKTSVPIVLATSYVAKGRAYSEISLYQLVYTGVVSDEPFKRPTITFEGLIFNKRLPINTDPKKFLEQLWLEGSH